jgi:hypothetical protein
MEHDSPPAGNAGGGADAEGALRRKAGKKRDDVYWDADAEAFTVVCGAALGTEHLHLEYDLIQSSRSSSLECKPDSRGRPLAPSTHGQLWWRADV